MALKPWDERYNPLTGHWTCPMCLQRRGFDEGQSDELGHLCDECTGILRNRWPTAVESGLRWVICKSIQYRWILELDGYPWGAVVWCWGEWLAGVRVYRALRYVHWVHGETVAVHVATGSLSACAHALVNAVREKR